MRVSLLFALTVTVLVSSAHADVTIDFQAEFANGLSGGGSFLVDAGCRTCRVASGPSEFDFRLGSTEFALERLLFTPASGSLSGTLSANEGFSSLVFTPSGLVEFISRSDERTLVLHGAYSVNGAASPSPSGFAAVPEPNSLILLGTAVAAIVVGRFAARKRPVA